MMEHRIKISQYGKVAGGRVVASKIREEVLLNQNVILDFSDVRTVSHAFADELLGKLAELKGRDVFKNEIKIENLNESNKAICRYVIADRTKSP